MTDIPDRYPARIKEAGCPVPGSGRPRFPRGLPAGRRSMFPSTRSGVRGGQ